jgi:hypothetical protein
VTNADARDVLGGKNRLRKIQEKLRVDSFEIGSIENLKDPGDRFWAQSGRCRLSCDMDQGDATPLVTRGLNRFAQVDGP